MPRTIQITLAEAEVPVLKELLEERVRTLKSLAQMSMTTDAERELYRFRTEVVKAVLDQMS